MVYSGHSLSHSLQRASKSFGFRGRSPSVESRSLHSDAAGLEVGAAALPERSVAGGPGAQSTSPLAGLKGVS